MGLSQPITLTTGGSGNGGGMPPGFAALFQSATALQAGAPIPVAAAYGAAAPATSLAPSPAPQIGSTSTTPTVMQDVSQLFSKPGFLNISWGWWLVVAALAVLYVEKR